MRREERGEGKDFLMGWLMGCRREGMRKRWRIEVAIVAEGGWQYNGMGERESLKFNIGRLF